MPRVIIIRAQAGQKSLDVEIARLRGLDAKDLRARWRTILRKEAPAHLPRHLLFRILAHRIQVNALGDLDNLSQRFLEQTAIGGVDGKQGIQPKPVTTALEPGTILSREWNGRTQRVAVLADGFAWNGKTYRSLSKAASAITGAHWNGPRFFGLRDKPKTGRGAGS